MVNAIVQTAFAKALDEANRIDELMKSDSFEADPRFSIEKMPYLGVPITCKEIIYVKVIKFLFLKSPRTRWSKCPIIDLYQVETEIMYTKICNTPGVKCNSRT